MNPDWSTTEFYRERQREAERVAQTDRALTAMRLRAEEAEAERDALWNALRTLADAIRPLDTAVDIRQTLVAVDMLLWAYKGKPE